MEIVEHIMDQNSLVKYLSIYVLKLKFQQDGKNDTRSNFLKFYLPRIILAFSGGNPRVLNTIADSHPACSCS